MARTSGAGDAARLLAQDVLARLGRAEDPLLANAGRQRHVDGIDVAAVEQFLVTAAGGGCRRERDVGLAFVDELLGTAAIAAGDGDQRGVPGVADRLPVLAGDVGRAEDSPAAKWLRHRVDLWSMVRLLSQTANDTILCTPDVGESHAGTAMSP